MALRYCINCLLPETKPDLSFDSKGVCSACTAFTNRKNIDWESRKKEFFKIIDRFKHNNPRGWDCIVPVSGGKDSTAQVLKMLELGLNPLAVNSRTCDLSILGKENLENLMNDENYNKDEILDESFILGLLNNLVTLLLISFMEFIILNFYIKMLSSS